MDGNAATEIAEIGIRLVDDAYLAWLSAESESGRTLRAWYAGSGTGLAYQAYQASLDREEAAARDLKRLCELTAPAGERLLANGDAGPHSDGGKP